MLTMFYADDIMLVWKVLDKLKSDLDVVSTVLKESGLKVSKKEAKFVVLI